MERREPDPRDPEEINRLEDEQLDPEDLVPGVSRPRPWATFVLMGINIVVWLLPWLWGGAAGADHLMRYGAQDSPRIWSGEYWRFVTPIFLHAGFAHLAFNTWALLNLGAAVELAYGVRRFLLVYFFAGVAGNLFSVWLGPPLSVGASGAIFGLFGPLLVMAFALPRESRRTLLVPLLQTLAINLVFGLVNPAVNNWAHGGGLIGGLALGAWYGPPGAPLRRSFRMAVGAVVVVGTLALAAASLRPALWYRTYNQAVALLHAGDLRSAEVLVMQSIEAQPGYVGGYLLLARIYADTGRVPQAVRLLRGITRSRPDVVEAQELLRQIERRQVPQQPSPPGR